MEATAINLDTLTAPPVLKQSPTLLRATGIRKAFGGQVVLDGIDLELRQGEVVLLRGENGSGKTTLLNILTGNIEPDTGEIAYSADDTPRGYRFPRKLWQELSPWDHFKPEFVANEGVGRTWQDIRLFRSLPLRDNITVAEPNHPGETLVGALLGSSRSETFESDIRARADAALRRVGLGGRESSSADKISLGQSKRVAIARAVASGARVLFLDEPLAGLDREGIADILELLKQLVAEGVTLVVIEHVFNQSYLESLVTTVWELSKARLGSSSIATGGSLRPSPLNSRLVAPAQTWLRMLGGDDACIDESLPRGASVTRIPTLDLAATPNILEIRNLIVRRGTRTVIGLDENGVVSGFNLTIAAGQTVILQAPNGWGKSTLLAAICGLIEIAEGEIFLNGVAIHDLPTWERVRRGLRALPAENNTFPGLRAREAMSLAGGTARTSSLGALAERVTSSLSGGERQRVALLCHASAEVAALQIFDEPFSMLDHMAIGETASLLRSNGRGATLIAAPALSTKEERHS